MTTNISNIKILVVENSIHEMNLLILDMYLTITPENVNIFEV